MPTTGFKLPAARTIDAGNGTWTNDVNVLTDDGAEATFSLTTKNVSGRWLRGQTFGFDTAVPAGATIDQVNIRMEYRVNSTGGIANPQCQAFVGGVAVGAVRTASPLEPTVLTLNTFNVTADRAWTRADLLNASFEMRIRGTNGNSTTDPSYRWDLMAVEVVYTEAGATTHALSATGTGTSAGTAPLKSTLVLAGTGTGTSAGTAPLIGTLALASTGTGASAGSANLTIVVAGTTYDLTATGTGTSAGSAALRATNTLASTGTGTSTGAAALRSTLAASATGTGTSAGAANLTIVPTGPTTWSLSSTGVGTSDGLAALAERMALAALGVGTSAGTAALTIVGVGGPFTVGEAATGIEFLGGGTASVEHSGTGSSSVTSPATATAGVRGG
jgi:hypothetical protein